MRLGLFVIIVSGLLSGVLMSVAYGNGNEKSKTIYVIEGEEVSTKYKFNGYRKRFGGRDATYYCMSNNKMGMELVDRRWGSTNWVWLKVNGKKADCEWFWEYLKGKGIKITDKRKNKERV